MENREGQKIKWVTKEADTSLALQNSVFFSLNTIKALRRLKGFVKFQAMRAKEIVQLVQKCMPLPELNQD